MSRTDNATSALPCYQQLLRLDIKHLATDCIIGFYIFIPHLLSADEFQIPPQTQMLSRYMPFYLKTKIFISTILIASFLSCTDKNSNCLITFEKIKESDTQHILINQTDKEIEDKNVTKNNVGGYYSFYENGLMKSYYFFTDQDTTYNKNDKSNEVIEDNATDNIYSFCSYAELYDSIGHLKKVYGNPLVLKETEISKNGRINVTLHFYSFNKFYDYINVHTNTNNVFQLTVTKDSTYSNMQKTFFSYNFKNVSEIKIYIQTNFLDCANKRENLSDSIIINTNILTEAKNGM